MADRTRFRIDLGLAATLALGGWVGCVAAQMEASEPPDQSIAATWDVVAAESSTTAKSEAARPAKPELASPAAEMAGATPLERAAAELGAKRWRAALDALEGGAQAAEGSKEWFAEGAIRGRAYRHLGQPAKAVEALQPIVRHKKLARNLPPELVGLELARARLDLADQKGTDRNEADELRRAAAKLLGKLRKKEPLRNLAMLRVTQARAIGAIEGKDKKSRFWAGKKAVKALDKVIKDYLRHPEVGELRLMRARALERKGQTKEAASALRAIATERAGEPEAEVAWRELGRLADEHAKIKRRPWSTGEKLERAVWARRHRRLTLSRQLLDDVIAAPGTPSFLRKQAVRSRAYTAYKQRDFATCAADLRPVFERTGSYEVRDDLLRCLQRGHQYDEAINIWLAVAKNKKGGTRNAAVWRALRLAFLGGQYQRAADLLARYEKSSKGNPSERRWLRAWLAYRLGKDDKAIERFAELARRSKGDAKMARYFRGKLLLRSKDKAKRREGVEVLRALESRNTLSYYGIMARQRLIDAGEDPRPAPAIEPMDDEARPPNYLDARKTFAALVGDYGDAWPALVRADQLHRAGYMAEARRELRVAIDAYRTVKNGKLRSPRNEAIIVGLGWKAEWDYPRVRATRAGRKTLRDREASEQLRAGMRTLANALDEPYRYAKLTSSAKAGRHARWHPRAFRGPLEREAKHRGIDPIHLWSLMYTESRFRPHVVSPVGARGALQIMPWTARQLAERLDEIPTGRFDTDRLYDIDTNSHLAAYYIAELLHKFHGQAAMAYASYNGGPSNVARWLAAKSNGPTALELDAFIEEIPFRETYRYTKRVLETYAIYHLLYKGELPRYGNETDSVIEDNIDF